VLVAYENTILYMPYIWGWQSNHIVSQKKKRKRESQTNHVQCIISDELDFLHMDEEQENVLLPLISNGSVRKCAMWSSYPNNNPHTAEHTYTNAESWANAKKKKNDV
jgi:hypothetical protein